MIGDPMEYAYYKQLQIMSKFMPKTVHSYLFHYKGAFSFSEKYANRPGIEPWVIHGDDQIYLFNSHNLTTAYDLEVMRTMINVMCIYVGGTYVLAVSEDNGVFKGVSQIGDIGSGIPTFSTNDINVADTMRFWNKWLWRTLV